MESVKRSIISIILVLLFFCLQTGFFEWISLGGIVPNLLIVLVVSTGLINEEKQGMLCGFFSGLLVDIFFMNVIGYHALVYCYIGYVSGLMHKHFFFKDVRLPAFMIAGADFVQSLLYYILFFLLNGEFDFGYYLLHVIFAELIYTLGVSIFIYPLILLLEYKIIRVPLWRNKKDAG